MKNHLLLSAIKILVFKRVCLILACPNSLNFTNNGLRYFLCFRHLLLDSLAQESLRCLRFEAPVGISGFNRPNWVTSPVLCRIFKFVVKTRRR